MKATIKLLRNMLKGDDKDESKMWAYDSSELGKRENTRMFKIATQMRNIMARKDLLGEEDKELIVCINYLFMKYSRKMREIEWVKKEVAKYGWEAVRATKEKQLNKLLREHGDPA